MLIRRLLAVGLSVALGAAAVALMFQSVRAAPASATYFVALNGNSSACSQANPCLIAYALSNASPGDTIYVKQGTYTNTASAVIQVFLSITLYGGWSGNASGQPMVDPAAYPSIIDGQNSRRGVYVSSGITPTIDGFTIRNGNATGLVDSCSLDSAAGCGGGIFVDQAAARILNNTIVSNTALVTSTELPEGGGGGVYLEAADGSVISANVFLGNHAVPADSLALGEGGGLDVGHYNPNSIIIQNNIFTANSAYWGGGLALDKVGAAEVRGNLFQNNTAGSGGGLYAWYATAGVADNTFRRNTAPDAPAYLGYFDGSFNANLVVDNPAPAGLQLIYGVPAQSLIIANNIIAHNGRIGIQAQGYLNAPLTAYALNNTLVGPGSGAGLVVADGDVTLTANNTLFSGFSTGVVVSYPATSTVSADYTLFDTDVASIGNASFSHNVFGAASFVDPANRNYHINFNSAARDHGDITILNTDFDGDPRPLGGANDIGADETRFLHGVFLALTRR